jgi:hypothetical protein
MQTPHEKRFSDLKASLSQLGPYRRGTVLRRFMPCGKPGCRCQASPPKLHGPYYDWTRKVKGKTVTVRLTPQQAQLFRQWIANARRLDRILQQLDHAAFRMTEPLLKAARRPSRQP